MRSKISLTTAFLFISFLLHAAKVDTVDTFSAAMNKKIKAVVITPENYASAKALPVFYLLHGHGGSYKDWPTRVKELTSFSDQKNMMIVCADGNVSSWYFDSPVEKDWKYETYVSKELVEWVDKNYKTIKNRTGRAISGLSMGGHGALYLAIKHQDVFGAAGSTSGGVDFRPFPEKWNISKRLGDYATNKKTWDENTVVNLLHLLKPNSLTLIIDCGTEDFFYPVNLNLHQQLRYNNIPHDFISRPGAHNWDYWANSIKYQVLFMDEYFKKNNQL